MSWRDHDTANSHWVASSDEPGLHLHLRAHGDEPSRPPVLMVHGATYASRLYDIPYPGASWLRATAEAGFAAYALDIRGYGKSRSAVMGRADTPYAPASAAICDIDDAVAWICARHGVETVRLIGGSWGSITTAQYTSAVRTRVPIGLRSALVSGGRRGAQADVGFTPTPSVRTQFAHSVLQAPRTDQDSRTQIDLRRPIR
jgi:pimeloyl-ACP methyl ester carboxylesterase